jgi:hypothetical protein
MTRANAEGPTVQGSATWRKSSRRQPSMIRPRASTWRPICRNADFRCAASCRPREGWGFRARWWAELPTLRPDDERGHHQPPQPAKHTPLPPRPLLSPPLTRQSWTHGGSQKPHMLPQGDRQSKIDGPPTTAANGAAGGGRARQPLHRTGWGAASDGTGRLRRGGWGRRVGRDGAAASRGRGGRGGRLERGGACGHGPGRVRVAAYEPPGEWSPAPGPGGSDGPGHDGP